MPVHPLFQQILDDLQRRPDYAVRDDAEWPDLPDVTLVEDEGGAVHVIHDPVQPDAERAIELADERERLHDPFFNQRRR